jgi:uncharacterized protein with PQ loop repeat
MTEILGWASSLVLLVTIGKQIHKQWRDDSSAGVSKWLFIGQFTASLGFTVYSYLVRNWVFVVTNLLMAASAVTGLLIVLYHRRRTGSSNGAEEPSEPVPTATQSTRGS